MKQYWEIKSLHQDKVLLFRMGDFFEMFFDDAVQAAPILGIALTQRNKKSSDETPMCGFPHHAVAGPINKLLAHGLRVAICDQIEDPKTAKGIVKRAVTRVLTPGMVYDPDTLDQSQAHYLCSIEQSSLAFVDMTTGESFFFENLNDKDLQRMLQVLPVAELVVSPDFKGEEIFGAKPNFLISPHAELKTHPKLNVQTDNAAVARLVSYILSLNSEEQITHLQGFEKRDLKKRLEISATTLRHLEVFATYKGDTSGSFFHCIQRTKTSAGTRLLRQWMSFPLRNLSEIQQRQSYIESSLQSPEELKKLRSVLGAVGDLERRLGKISQPQSNGRDLLALSQSLFSSVAAFENSQALGFLNLKKNLVLDEIKNLAAQIEAYLIEEPPISTRQGYMIKKGVHAQLDELIELTTETQNLVLRLEAKEKEATGISSLKVRYNNVFGFYIEITNTHKDKAPAHYQRKQTLANAERYCTEELIELEKKVLSAQSKRNDLEYEIFEGLRAKVLKLSTEILKLSAVIAQIDVLTSLAWLALEEDYVKPSFSKDRSLRLVASRHPVVEQNVRSNFIPNDIMLGSGHCLLLTGPNMAGKSTLMRQVALAAILAQMGSFVPAKQAELPLYDAIFTRIGASDQLSEGLSTFMVEMTETAALLKEATENSLLVLDEVGRGTSTFDGMSLAHAILEYLITQVRGTLFFATHYHELTRLNSEFPVIHNAHMSVVEKNGEIRFLHTLRAGPAQKSYGVQVAELAGLPSAVTKKAKTLLKELENHSMGQHQLSLLNLSEINSEIPEQKFTEVAENYLRHLDQASLVLLKEIADFPLSTMTPLEALNQISKWQKEILNLNKETSPSSKTDNLRSQ